VENLECEGYVLSRVVLMLPPGWTYIHTEVIQIGMCGNKGNIKKGQHMQYMGYLMILRRLAKSAGINKRKVCEIYTSKMIYHSIL